MSFFVMQSLDPNFQRGRVWTAYREHARTNPDGTVMCRDVNLARVVSTSGFKIVINPLLGKKAKVVREEGSLPMSRAEAADFLGVPSMIIDTWEKSGKLKAYYMKNNGPQFARADVERLAANRDKE